MAAVLRVSSNPNALSISSLLGLRACRDRGHLKQHILVRPPLSVFEPMQHFVFSAPPSPGPALCVAACELVGGHRDQAIAAAAALHLMHAAAVIHEQLLSTGRPKIKPKSRPMFYSPGVELLTGDGIFAFGCELLSKSMDPAQTNSDRDRRNDTCHGVTGQSGWAIP